MRAALGRMSCGTASELQAQGGPDAEGIRRTAAGGSSARPRAACHLCEGGPDTRAYFPGLAASRVKRSWEGSRWREVGPSLAAMVDSLWFSPNLGSR